MAFISVLSIGTIKSHALSHNGTSHGSFFTIFYSAQFSILRSLTLLNSFTLLVTTI